MMMKKYLVCCLIFLVAVSTIQAHNSIVGHLTIENFDHEIYVSASMHKRFLTMALMHEADCSPKNMLSICGSQYVLEHVEFMLNGNSECLQYTSMQIQKDFVVFKYKVSTEEKTINQIDLKSDYMVAYEEHATLRVAVNIDDHVKSYDLSAMRNELKITIK